MAEFGIAIFAYNTVDNECNDRWAGYATGMSFVLPVWIIAGLAIFIPLLAFNCFFSHLKA